MLKVSLLILTTRLNDKNSLKRKTEERLKRLEIQHAEELVF